MTEGDRADNRVRLAALLRNIADGVHASANFYEAMIEADVREAMREFELPHVVVCFSPETGYLTVEGPFEDGLLASRMAEQDVEIGRLSGSDFVYLVLPLLPPRPATR